MVFELFITKLQNMYNIFEEEGEPTEEYAKIRFLFKQVKYLDLTKSIEALKYYMETNLLGAVSYTTSANSLITSIYELPEYVSRGRSVIAVSKGCGDQDGA